MKTGKQRFHGFLSYLYMISHHKRLNGLDHLRAAAIILVLLFHYNFYYGVPEWLDSFSRFGWSGVDLFFVLSGYLITDKLFREFDARGRIGFRGFYLNRVLRIFPAYLVVVGLYFSFPDLQEGRGLQPLWKFLTFTQNISIDLYKNTFSHAWSLCVEEHFYLLLPILLYFIFSRNMSHRAVYFFIAVAALGIIIRYSIWEAYVAGAYGQMRIMAAIRTIYYPTYCRLDGLLVGVSIASIFKYKPALKEKLVKHGNGLLALSFLLLVVTYFLFGGSLVSQKFTSLLIAVFGFPLVSIAYGLMVVAAMSPKCFLSRVKFWPTAMLATLSYAIYLSHKMINHLLNTNLKQFLELEPYQAFALCLLGAVIGGVLLHLAVEKPFLLLRAKLKV